MIINYISKLNLHFLLIYIVTMTVGCTFNTEKVYHVGITQDGTNLWRQKMRSDIEQEMVLHPELKLHYTDAGFNSDIQQQQIDSLVATGIDLLIVYTSTPEQILPAVERAYNRGIQILVTYPSPMSSKYTASVCTDNYYIGQLMGQYALRYQQISTRGINEPLHILELTGPTNTYSTQLRHAGLINTLNEEQVDITTLTCPNWSYSEAFILTDSLLDLGKQIDVIVSQNDIMALGANEACIRYDASKNFHILGADALPGPDGGIEGVLNGKIEASVINVNRGQLIIQTADAILHNIPFTRDTLLQPVLVDQSSRSIIRRMLMDMNDEHMAIDLLRIRMNDLWEENYKRQITITWLVVIAGILLTTLLFFIFFAHYRIRVQRERANIAIKMARQEKQLESMAAELERVKTSQTQDEKFVAKLQNAIETHIDDATLTVNVLGQVMSMSRAQIFRKTKQLLGISPVEVIRQMRLRKAKQMLRMTDQSIQQIAYACGFTSPSYFTKCYKQFFGYLPAEERKKL